MNKRTWIFLSIGAVVAVLPYTAYRIVVSKNAKIALTSSERERSKCRNPSASITLSGTACSRIQPPQLSCYLPNEVEGALNQPNFSDRQRASDIFSWQEFIALNWPSRAGQRGVPDWSKKITDAGSRVWETWKEENEIYLKDGAKPSPWNAPEKIPEFCKMEDVSKHFFRTQKIDDVLDSTIQAAAADGTLPATLTDQKGHVVRYEIRLNKGMFDYIVEHRLYDGRIQNAVKSVSFPDGAILVKAGWREAGADEEGFYHTVRLYSWRGQQFLQTLRWNHSSNPPQPAWAAILQRARLIPTTSCHQTSVSPLTILNQSLSAPN